MPCKKCSLPIDPENELFTRCSGRCSQPFHALCVEDFSADTARALKCRNLIWLCDDCLVEFGSNRYREVDEDPHQQQLMNEITELKVQVAEISGMLSDVQLTRSTEGECSRNFVKHSTPVSNKSPNSTTMHALIHRPPSQGEKNECSTIDDGRSFSLMLSNINNRVTDGEINQLVSRSLGTAESDIVKVTKLVPRWKDCEELEYVSFKVVLDRKWKNAALNASTWPKQVRYREFVDRRAVAWSPS